MNLFQAIVLGIVQGVTEFIPVSSSAHLVLVPWLLGWESPGLVFDTVVHWGTLVAVAVVGYFWRDWVELIAAWLRGLVRWDWHEPQARLMWLIILGTLPAVVIGFALEDLFESLFGRPVWVIAFLFVTAGLLAVSERLSERTRRLGDLRWGDALAIGLGQAAAIAPGISRSGATISVGLFRGLVAFSCPHRSSWGPGFSSCWTCSRRPTPWPRCRRCWLALWRQRSAAICASVSCCAICSGATCTPLPSIVSALAWPACWP